MSATLARVIYDTSKNKLLFNNVLKSQVLM